MIRVRNLVGIILLIFNAASFGKGFDSEIQFIENKGQWDAAVLYRAEIRNGYLFITRKGLEYVFYDADGTGHKHTGETIVDNSNARRTPPDPEGKRMVNMHAVAMEFVDPSATLKVNPLDTIEVYYNYYLGNDPEKWADHVRAFKTIRFRGIYPGIHLEIYSRNGHLKYDIEVEQQADPGTIRFRYQGTDRVDLKNNSIHARTSLNTIIENTPYSYQIIENDTVPVPSRFFLKDDIFGFEFPDDFDRARKLIIDPLLVFSTYSGSSYDNWGNTATFDSKGNVYSGGTVQHDIGFRFPVTRGAFQTTYGGIWDIGILKFDSTGSRLLYGTYLGGSGTETPFSIIANQNNELIVLGITGSADFPTTENAYSRTFQGGDSVFNALGPYNDFPLGGIDYYSGSDLFIVKLSESGSRLLGSTYLGGSENDGINNAYGLPLSRNYGDEFRGEVNVDDNDYIYIAANTSSEDFPVIDGFQDSYGGGTHDGVVAKLTPDLSGIVWSSFIGGDLADAVYGIKILPGGQSYITGGTMSENFPVTDGAFDTRFGGDVDGFLASISGEGNQLLASTFIGTAEYDQTYFLDIDPEENIYVLGQTKGMYPVSEGIYHNPRSGQFIHKLSQDLSTSLLSTVVGSGSGIPDISPTAFLVNECGNLFISGWGGGVNNRASKYNGGNTFGMPITDDAYQRNTDGSDFYLMVLDADADRLLYGTFLGALNEGPGEHVDGGTCRFDKRGIVYHAICSCDDNSQFPTTPNVWSNVNGSTAGRCNNGVFKFDLSALRADFTTDSWEFDDPGVTSGCMPFEVVFLNKSFGGESFEWDFGDGKDKSNQEDSLFYIYEKNGIYTVTLKAFDENTCLKVDVARKNIVVYEPQFIIPEDRSICQFDQTQLVAEGGVSYRWRPESGLSATMISNPVASPDSTTMYYLEMTDINQCSVYDSVLVTVMPEIKPDFMVNKLYDCYSPPKVEVISVSANANQLSWNFGDGMLWEGDSIVHVFDDPGNYTIKLTASNEGRCVKEKEETIRIPDIFVPNIITPNGDTKNDRFEIITDATVDLIIFNRWGKKIFSDKDYRNNWAGSDVPTGTYFYEIKLDDDATCKGWLQVLK